MNLFDYLCENCIKINTVSLWKWYEINIFINHYLTVTLQIFTYRLSHSIFDQCYHFFFQSCNHNASLTMSCDLPSVWISLIPCGPLQFSCQFFFNICFFLLYFFHDCSTYGLNLSSMSIAQIMCYLMCLSSQVACTIMPFFLFLTRVEADTLSWKMSPNALFVLFVFCDNPHDLLFHTFLFL